MYQHYCPKCHKITTGTTHEYYDDGDNLIRTEEVCDSCHQTVMVRHYTPKGKTDKHKKP